MTVEHLAVKKSDNTLWTPEQVLYDVLEEVKRIKPEKFDKAFVIMVQDGDIYAPKYWASNLKLSEIIALLETIKQAIIMERIQGEET